MNHQTAQKDLSDINENFGKQLENQDTAAKTLVNIILKCQNEQKPIIKSFTPTRQNSSITNPTFGSNSEQYMSMSLLFGSEQKVKDKKKAQLIEKINSLQSRVFKLQKIQTKINKSRRIRRTSNQILKIHQCPVESCAKNYGTETALKKHVRTKHSQTYTFRADQKIPFGQKQQN